MAARIVDLSFLTPSLGFTVQGDLAGDFAGFSVSTAGDVNGDGLTDFVIGASGQDAGGFGAGGAYVLFGRNDGFSDIDLSSLTASDGFFIQGHSVGDTAGFAVSGAGDVNGDGFDDVLVGAYGNDAGGTSAGAAYVIFGKGTAFSTVDLSTLPVTDGFTIIGDDADDFAGRAVSSAGDVNGDGIDDFIVGASYGDDGGAFAGEAYVIFGKTTGFSNIDLSSFTASDGFIIQGDEAGDHAGISVSSAGDINGDGYGDIVVGAVNGDDGGTQAGEAYVIFGRNVGFTNIDLTGLALSDGFIIQGDVDGDFAGRSVSGAGDVNGDGYDDIIVGAYGGDDTASSAGEAYVLFGKASGFTNIDLTGLAASDGFILRGGAAGDFAGYSVANAGDVNADGYDDMLIGAYGQNDGGNNAGAAYVVFGKASGFGTVDLAALGTGEGIVIIGDEADDLAGQAVAGAGDVNGDGIDDVLIGASGGDNGGAGAGEAYVVYGGSATGFGARVELASLGGDYGFSVRGVFPEMQVGWAVSGAGDMNGDGIDDFVVGSPHPGLGNGAADVVYGRVGGYTDSDIIPLAASNGFRAIGEAVDDWAGYAVSAAGDVNADGYDDLIVGSPHYGGSDEGRAYIIYGGVGLAPWGGVTRNVILNGNGNANAGFSVAGAGDFNGDGISDVIVGAPANDDAGNDAGEAYVLFGGVGGIANLTLSDTGALSPDKGFAIRGDAAGDLAGFDVARAGDVNGDGFDDVLVGAFYGSDGGALAGETYLIFGTSSGIADIDLTGLSASVGIIIQGDAAGDRLGTSVSWAGDVNGDGFDDIIVGAYAGDDGGVDAGEAYVLLGKASGWSNIDLSSLSSSDGFKIVGGLAGDGAGVSVSRAGDINGDGFDDMVVGARGVDINGSESGASYVIFGKASGFSDIDLGDLAPSEGFMIVGEADSDWNGHAVSAAGDVNHDGIDDLIVGSPMNDEYTTNSGKAYVIYGRRASSEVTLTGTDIGQRILGGHLDDILNGLGGEDDLQGGDGDDTLDGGDDDDRVLGGMGSDTLRGGAGRDWVRGGDDGDMVEGGDDRDWLFGDDGDDDLDGGEGADRLEGGAGADDLDGGVGGADLAVYKKSAAGVTVDLGAGTGTGGDAQGDTLTGIERVMGSDHGDTLTGDANANLLIGRGGDDVLTGLGGRDKLRGDAGEDELYGGDERDVLEGGADDDILDGGDGDDRLTGGAGGDDIDGGAGEDTALYTGSGSGVTIDLGGGTAALGDAVGDTLTSIEHLIGSMHGDILGGDANGNTLNGLGGADILSGQQGDDRLIGHDGNDTLYGGDDRDVLIGGADADTMVGGNGADRFVFKHGDTGLGAAADRITDYEVGTDRIILRSIDADTTTGGDQAFTFGGTLTLNQSGGDTIIALDTDGDTVADAEIHLTGLLTLTAGDFVL
ncbi:hypothetical protein [uncultured Maritimibacter sp.]|uniref:beta strand repeat-containing protein n=1 Tax=uncultured Maritimibacter sp. TaxID=991866 RepID=UPI0025945512|nr:hypothetical protein [uncultured Maritimibacter sp.]